MKKVLVIGAKGMLGQELIKAFSGKKYEVIGWDREDIDIIDPKQITEKITALKPDVIFNTAAYTAVDKCEESKEEYAKAKKLNGDAPGYLAKVAKKIDAILVHYSTDYVFNGMPEFPEPSGCTGMCSSCGLHAGFVPELGFREDDIPDPIQKYGKTKLMGEDAVQKYGEKWYVIRLQKLFGKPGISEGSKRSFFDVMLEAGRKNDEVRVVDEETSNFTYAPDLAKRSREIVEKELPFGIYHVSNPGACTWYEAVLELYKMAKIKVKVVAVSGEEFPRPAKRPYVSTLINTKLTPLRSWKEALKEYLSKNAKVKNQNAK